MLDSARLYHSVLTVFAGNHVPSPNPHLLPPNRYQGRLIAAGRSCGGRSQARLAGQLGLRHCLAAQREARPAGGVVRRHRAGARHAETAAGRAQARGSAGRCRHRPDRAGPLVVGKLQRARHRHRPSVAHAGRHRGAPPLSQCPLDHRQIAGMAHRAGDQRERHRRHVRNPLRRQ